MNIQNLPRNPKGGRALNDLVFTDINDSPDNPRFGLGYHQLYDEPNGRVGLIARLPDVTRPGDTITLYWDSVVVQQFDLDDVLIEKGWLSFSVPPSFIFEPRGEVYYTLYDHQADDLQTSLVRTIAVDRYPPGGLDEDLSTGFNDHLLPCTVNPNPITDPAAPVTVSVLAWRYQAIGDELTVMWNHIRVDHPKLQALGPQTVIIPRAVLEQGGSSDSLLVNYEIRDIVDNYSLVSQPTYVTVEIDPNDLRAARVREADPLTLVLDLEALGDNDAHVLIPTYLGNGRGYVVTLSWEGKTPTADIILRVPPQRVEDPDFDHAEFTIPNAHMKLIAGGSAVVRYSLVQDGDGSTKKSKTTTITISGQPVQLREPEVVEANGTKVIDLADITGTQVTVRIAAYTGQSAGDKVLLNWKGIDAQGLPVNYSAEYEIKAGEELRDTTFPVGRENLDPLANGKLDLSYQVVFKATGITGNSEVSYYTVKGVATGPVTGFESFEEQLAFVLPLDTAVPFNNNLTINVTATTRATAVVVPPSDIPQFGQRALRCAASNSLRFEFGGTIDELKISHAQTMTSQSRLEFFDVDGRHLLTYTLIPPAPPEKVRYERISLSPPSRSSYVVLTVDSAGLLVDNLTWR